MKKILKFSFTTFFYILIYNFILYIVFSDILNSKALIFPYFDGKLEIISKSQNSWNIIKKIFIISNISSSTLILIYIQHSRYKTLKKQNEITNNEKFKFKENKRGFSFKNSLNPLNPRKLNLMLGFSEDGEIRSIDEESAFQNIIITGGIGTGKTASAMYSLTEQIIKYRNKSEIDKIGMLILDVKGNYHKFVSEIAKKYEREGDLIVIDAEGENSYNPLDKPELKAKVIAERLKYILLLFSPNNSESFWIDKSEQLIAEVIKFIRIYNDNYVDFLEIHKVVNYIDFYNLQKEDVKKRMLSGEFSDKDIYEINMFFEYYEKEFMLLDERTKGIIKAEISRITSTFISDYKIKNLFCAKKGQNTFKGFEELISKGKIVVLNMNIAEYSTLSKLVAAYLKLDFQGEVLKKVTGNNTRKVAFISDEYQEYVTKNDANFYAQSRESKCINIVATQSYSSLKERLPSEDTSNVIIQNLSNKLWFRTDDEYTIERAQKIIGKEEKRKISKTISESGNESGYSIISNSFKIEQANLSESLNSYTEFDYKFDTKQFTQDLKNFEALGFISNQGEIQDVSKIYMVPYFIRNN